jgi:prephenate dehydrogenase
MKRRQTLFKQVTIIAPGLLGGSLGLAIKKRKVAGKVVVWARRLENAQAAVRKKAADRYEAELKGAVKGSDLVILCSPVEAMGELAREFRSGLGKEALVTDVGSVKYDVVSQLSHALGKRAVFIGSHPMAGSEQSGIAAARADLFEGSVCLVTPTPGTNRKKLHQLVQFWQAVGCKVATLSPSQHDEVVARISHLPHLVSAALVNLAARKGAEIFNYIGPGFRDMTRLAGGPPEMWSGICMSNHNEIRRAVDEMIEQLENIRRATANRSAVELRAYLRRAKSLRDEIKFRE